MPVFVSKAETGEFYWHVIPADDDDATVLPEDFLHGPFATFAEVYEDVTRVIGEPPATGIGEHKRRSKC
jgi:hypothetical protein